MILFLICAGVGTVLLLLSLFGGDFDTSHGDFHVGEHHGDSDSVSVFSYRTIVSFLAAFGASGALCLQYGLSFFLSAILGVISGIFFGLMVWWFIKLAMSQQSNSIVSMNDLINQNAVVTTAIFPGSVGEISVEFGGQRKHISAQSKGTQKIPEQTSVKIVEMISGIAIVE